MLDELWKPYNGYMVSNHGRVMGKRGQLLSLVVNKDGYHQFSMYVGKSKTSQLVHRLVAELFIGECPAGKDQVDHINHVRSDNRVTNLRWVTSQENSDNTDHRCGYDHPRSLLTPEQVSEIRSMDATLTSIAETYGVGVSTIHRIRNNKTYVE